MRTASSSRLTQFGGADQPVTAGIVVDESGSMGPKRPEVIGAALEFIKASNPHDEIFVVNFNEKGPARVAGHGAVLR